MKLQKMSLAQNSSITETNIRRILIHYFLKLPREKNLVGYHFEHFLQIQESFSKMQPTNQMNFQNQNGIVQNGVW